ncbi:MAG: valine--tRNA ligase [Candidatus Saccharimonadales bacterium]
MNLPKLYEPAQYEHDIYDLWERSGLFKADPTKKAEHYSIAMPPPNATGTLHVGHALGNTIQDILARYARMQGKDVLYLPGTDHAALATNAIMEKKLADEGTNKHEVGREFFIRGLQDFIAQSQNTMQNQLRAIGVSCDWSRERYTLDPALNRCVNETFVRMYNDKLIYRGHRIVNWDPNLETTIADDEIVRREEKAKFYTFQYGPFAISTARPETKFGDKYVVMHPDDARYKNHKHGETFTAEWINGPVTATIIKDTAVDPEFGTGVMTITPWHDLTDFEIAERHNLDKQQIIDFKGNLLPVAAEFSGMSINEARPKIVDKLAKKGLLISIDEDYLHSIALNSRGGGVIEPQIKLQWFVDVNKQVVEWKGKRQSLKQVMRDVIESGDITMVPARFNKTYYHWIDNLRDWCISRQIWWGHRIPVWYRNHEEGSETYVGTQPPIDDGKQGWHSWEQDPDTLDTWFSSALWTWSTLIDPALVTNFSLTLEDILQKSLDYQTYHPTTIMETGWDIIFFWVARMILSTTYMIGDVPFKTLYLHGLVRAEDGQKMSKSKPETSIDPMEVIPVYGSDALRLALISNITPGKDQRMSRTKIAAQRNFCNKLWNVARFVEDKLGDDFIPGKIIPQSNADYWILFKIQQCVESTSNHLTNYRISEAFDGVYHLLWDDFADWYIESSKIELNKSVLAHGLQTILKIVHPFAPFVSETIWQTLKWEGDSYLMTSTWPDNSDTNPPKAYDFEQIKTIISEIRNIKTVVQLGSNVQLYTSEESILMDNKALIIALAKIRDVKQVRDGNGLRLTNTTLSCWLDVDDPTAQQFVHELKIKLDSIQKSAKQLEDRLNNKAYTENAPKDIVDQTKKQLESVRLNFTKVSEEYGRYTKAT